MVRSLLSFLGGRGPKKREGEKDANVAYRVLLPTRTWPFDDHGVLLEILSETPRKRPSPKPVDLCPEHCLTLPFPGAVTPRVESVWLAVKRLAR